MKCEFKIKLMFDNKQQTPTLNFCPIHICHSQGNPAPQLASWINLVPQIHKATCCLPMSPPTADVAIEY